LSKFFLRKITPSYLAKFANISNFNRATLTSDQQKFVDEANKTIDGYNMSHLNFLKQQYPKYMQNKKVVEEIQTHIFEQKKGGLYNLGFGLINSIPIIAIMGFDINMGSNIFITSVVPTFCTMMACIKYYFGISSLIRAIHAKKVLKK